MKRNVVSNFLVLLIIIALLFVGLYITKYRIIISKVKSKLKDNIMNNYSYTVTTNTNNESLSKSTYYVMNQNFCAKIKSVSNDNIISIVSYKNEDNEIILLNKNGEKYYKINGKTNYKTDILIKPTNLKVFSEGIVNKIENMISEIVETEKNDKKCYLVIAKDGSTYWIEKETGIVISYIEDNYLYNLEYNINNVKGSDLVKPDTTEYAK